MTDKEKRIVMAVFGTLLGEHTRNELNAAPFNLGSLTIKEMQDMYNHLKYDDYCKSRGITYERMTEDDFMSWSMNRKKPMRWATISDLNGTKAR